MSILKDALESGKFGITAEMAPPKGYDFAEQMEAAECLAGKVHAVNVTDMQPTRATVLASATMAMTSSTGFFCVIIM